MRKWTLIVLLYIFQIATNFWPGPTIRSLNVDPMIGGTRTIRIEQSRVKYAVDYVPLVGLFTATSSCRWQYAVWVNSTNISFELDYELFLNNDDLSTRINEAFVEVWNQEKKLFAVRHSDVVKF
jgi:hypothetical protein